jgi:hypothetical protein
MQKNFAIDLISEKNSAGGSIFFQCRQFEKFILNRQGNYS